MEDDLLTKQYQIALENMRKELEDYDQQFFIEHRSKGYKVSNFRERSIATEFGTLRFKRREYSYLDKNQKIRKIIPVDEKFKLGKLDKIHPSLKKKILRQAGSGKRYRDIVDMFPKANISVMTISRLFRDCDFINKMSEVKKKVDVKNDEIIYINMDDTYASVYDSDIHKKYAQRFRVVSFHLGYENPKSNRKKLRAKRTFFMEDDVRINTTEKVAEEIQEWGNKFYNGFNQAKLVVGGDGATWIEKIAKYLKAEYVLDNFHAQAYLLKGFNVNKRNPRVDMKRFNLYKQAYNYFCKGSWDNLMKLLEITNVPKDTYSYFKHNKKGVESWANSWCIGVSAESDCSRLVQSVLGYGSKLFNKQTLYNLIGARAYKINNLGTY